MQRLRLLYGTFILIGGLCVYALLVMKLAVMMLPDQLGIQLFYYIVTGTVWIFPAIRLTKWMQDLPPWSRDGS